jgi:hypothetical protein
MTTFTLDVKTLSVLRNQESVFMEVKSYMKRTVQLRPEDRGDGISVVSAFNYPALVFEKKNDTGAILAMGFLDQKRADAFVQVTVDGQTFDKFDDFKSYVVSKIAQDKLNACTASDSAPQVASLTGGKTHTTFKGKNYVIRTGVRGGKYFVVKGKTHYL